MSSEQDPGIDLRIDLPAFWTSVPLSRPDMEDLSNELAELLSGVVNDPRTVAQSSVVELRDRLASGGEVVLVASFREEFDDGVFTASLIVSRNDLVGSIDPWVDAYPDAQEVMVNGRDSLRTRERVTVDTGDVFGEVSLVTWRYLVPFDERSLLLFAFSSPNVLMADDLEAHFDLIMEGVQFDESNGDLVTESPC